jgi:CRP-like cAMP-binding protein
VVYGSLNSTNEGAVRERSTTPGSPRENLLLCSLGEPALDVLRRHVRRVLLTSRSIIYEPGDLLTKAYFPENGAISLVVTFANGHNIETAMVGRDGMLGGLSALDAQRASHRAVVQTEGFASVIDLEILRQIARQHEAVRSMLFRHEWALFAQTQQLAACNASHGLEARLCRWLLRASDACGKRTLSTTQECIAELLGVKRTSVSLIAHAMQQAGLIRNRRSHVELINLNGLRERACECYAATARYYSQLTQANGATSDIQPAQQFIGSS